MPAKKQAVVKPDGAAKKAVVGKQHSKTVIAATPAKKAGKQHATETASAKPAKQAKKVGKQAVVATPAPAKKIVASKKGKAAYASVQPTPRKLRRVAMVDTAAATDASMSAPPRMPKLFASSNPVEEARRWIGTNPTDRNSLWCATFMNFVLERSGYSGTGSDAAKSFASYGRRISGPRVGAIAVLTRGKNGGHVGIVSGVDLKGNPIIISGNHNKKVGESVYSRSRVIAYVLPR